MLTTTRLEAIRTEQGGRSETADLRTIADLNAATDTWTVVLDDDPTGTQTISEAPVVLGEWTSQDLDWAIGQDSPLAFVSTNTRAMSGQAASLTVHRAVATARTVAAGHGRPVRIVARGDSTLRGHFGVEHEATRAASPTTRNPRITVFAPAFVEAGRYTACDTQWVQIGDQLVPAAHTEFARDTSFGYTEQSLTRWARHRWVTPHVQLITLDQLRSPVALTVLGQRFDEAPPETLFIVEAVRSGDLAPALLACFQAEQRGLDVAYRVGPSAIPLLIGRRPAPPLAHLHRNKQSGHGLVVVGSHTDVTNTQLDVLARSTTVSSVELDVHRLLRASPAQMDTIIDQTATRVLTGLATQTTVLSTSRRPTRARPETAMAATQSVATAVAAVVAKVCRHHHPSFLVAKGGITSSDIPTRSLSVSRATVLGQFFPGRVSLWRLENGSLPAIPYVVFPGNVGAPEDLAHVIATLEDQS